MVLGIRTPWCQDQSHRHQTKKECQNCLQGGKDEHLLGPLYYFIAYETKLKF